MDIAPRETRTVHVNLPAFDPGPGAEYWLTWRFLLRNETVWAEPGFEVAWEQFRLPVEAGSIDQAAGGSIRMVQAAAGWEIRTKDSLWTLDRQIGRLSSLRYRGVELLEGGPEVNLWRAPTANEIDEWRNPPIAKTWYDVGLDRLKSESLRVEVVQTAGNRVQAIVESEQSSPGSPLTFRIRSRYEFRGDDSLLVEREVVPVGDVPDWTAGTRMWLPRDGVQFVMPGAFSNLEWYGRGPFETYPDRKTGARMGTYRSEVAKEYVPYLNPQEHGNKTDVRWAALTDEAGMGLWMTGTDLQFSVHDCDQDNLTRALYPFQLVRQPFIQVNLDFRVTGVGGTPVPTLEEYRVPVNAYRWRTCLRPFDSHETSAVKLGRETKCE